MPQHEHVTAHTTTITTTKANTSTSTTTSTNINNNNNTSTTKRDRKATSRSSSNKKRSNPSSSRTRRPPKKFLDAFSNQRIITFSFIAMVICIIEFQGIHEARVQHKKLREFQEKDQAMLHAMNYDVQQTTVLSQQQDQHELQRLTKIPPSLFMAQQLQNTIAVNSDETHPSGNAQQHQDAIIASPVIVNSKWNLPPPSTDLQLIPEALRNLADLSDPYVKSVQELPFFWHVPKSGGTSVKHMYSDCYGLVEACESGVANGHLRDITLKVVTIDKSGWKFLNVDVTTPRGIERAARFNIVRSGKADLLVSPLPHDAIPALFTTPQYKARFFTVFRDPLERAVSLFYYLQTANHEPTYNPALSKLSLEEYAFSDLVESNFISRTLLNKMEAPLTEDDFLIVQEILRTKCLVGLLDQLEESVRRFDLYFSFVPQKTTTVGVTTSPTTTTACTDKYLNIRSNRQTTRPNLPAPESPIYQELLRKNHMDVRLYHYAQELFTKQAAMFDIDVDKNTHNNTTITSPKR